MTLTINVADKYTFSQLSSCPIDFLSSAFNSLDLFFVNRVPVLDQKENAEIEIQLVKLCPKSTAEEMFVELQRLID